LWFDRFHGRYFPHDVEDGSRFNTREERFRTKGLVTAQLFNMMSGDRQLASARADVVVVVVVVVVAVGWVVVVNLLHT
jgi:hypothetical protein